MSHEWKCSQVREMAKCFLSLSPFSIQRLLPTKPPPFPSGLGCMWETDTDVSPEHAVLSPALEKPSQGTLSGELDISVYF